MKRTGAMSLYRAATLFWWKSFRGFYGSMEVTDRTCTVMLLFCCFRKTSNHL